MTGASTGLRRLVLALPPSAASDESLRSALALASSLQLELLALLIEDERAFGAVSHGAGAEYRWEISTPRALDISALETEFGLWARRLERRIATEASAARLAFAVERVRGGLAAQLIGRLNREDLLAVLEPSGAFDRAFGAQAALAACAEGVCAALTVPARPLGESGVIVVLDTGRALDRARALAEALALATGAPVEMWGEEASDLAGAVALSSLGDEMALRRRLKDRVRLLIAPAHGPVSAGAARVLALAAKTGTPVLRPDGDAHNESLAETDAPASGGGKPVGKRRTRRPAR